MKKKKNNIHLINKRKYGNTYLLSLPHSCQFYCESTSKDGKEIVKNPIHKVNLIIFRKFVLFSFLLISLLIVMSFEFGS